MRHHVPLAALASLPAVLGVPSALLKGDEARFGDGGGGSDNVLAERSKLGQNCGGRWGQVVDQCLDDCAVRAVQAAAMARNRSADLFDDFFKTQNSWTRDKVAEIFDSIAYECGAGRNITAHCGTVTDDPSGPFSCNKGYTANAGGRQVHFCDKFFNGLPDTGKGSCGNQDKASLCVHEVSHIVGGTTDFGSYGFESVKKLGGNQNVRHADTISLFSQAVTYGCTRQDLERGSSPHGSPAPEPEAAVPGQDDGPSNKPKVPGEGPGKDDDGEGPGRNGPARPGRPQSPDDDDEGPGRNGPARPGRPQNPDDDEEQDTTGRTGPSSPKGPNTGPGKDDKQEGGGDGLWVCTMPSQGPLSAKGEGGRMMNLALSPEGTLIASMPAGTKCSEQPST